MLPCASEQLSAASFPSSSSASSRHSGPFPVSAFRFPAVVARSYTTAPAAIVDLRDDGHPASLSVSAHMGLRETLSQQSIVQSFSKAHDAVRDAAIAECFAVHFLPLSLIESPHFISMMDKTAGCSTLLGKRIGYLRAIMQGLLVID